MFAEVLITYLDAAIGLGQRFDLLVGVLGAVHSRRRGMDALARCRIGRLAGGFMGDRRVGGDNLAVNRTGQGQGRRLVAVPLPDRIAEEMAAGMGGARFRISICCADDDKDRSIIGSAVA